MLSPAVPGPQVVETSFVVGQGPWSDPGVSAFDDVDGNLSSIVSALGLGTLQAAVASGAPTEASEAFVVQYSVVDAAGNAAPTAVRIVHLVCSSAERLCYKPDGSTACTVDGVCDVMPSPEVTAEPASVRLVGPDTVFVAQGTPYHACSPDLPLSLLCDQV